MFSKRFISIEGSILRFSLTYPIQNNLLTPRTIQAHCTFLTAPDLEYLAHRQTSVAHCPLSNAYFSEKAFALREALNIGVKVGLGTDIAGGYSLDIMSAMRQAVVVSRMRESDRSISTTKSHNGRSLSINWIESLYLATRGGSEALALEGMFKVGAPFDAQESELTVGSFALDLKCFSYHMRCQPQKGGRPS